MNLICLDVETTGLQIGHDEILQLAIIDQDENILFYEKFKPVNRKRWSKAQSIHGISPEDVKDCHPISYYKEQIESIINSADFIIGYNMVKFDLPMLEQAGITSDKKLKGDDVMLMFSPVFKEYNRECRTGDRRNYAKLSECAEYYGYQGNKFHDALFDVKATLFCYKRVKDSLRAMKDIEDMKLKAYEQATQEVWGAANQPTFEELLKEEKEDKIKSYGCVFLFIIALIWLFKIIF